MGLTIYFIILKPKIANSKKNSNFIPKLKMKIMYTFTISVPTKKDFLPKKS